VAGVPHEVTAERFGRYLLLDKIGAGGMAEVFRAVMPGAEGFRRTFVVKRILGALSSTPTFVDMFVREARICSLLSHPGIVAVYDFGQIEGNYFLAMEYVRGRDLQALLRRLRKDQRSCPVSIAAFIAREVAECLAYAHDLSGADGKPLNIIHRDVSPSNIMCPYAGGVKLLDFGIAKALGDTPEDRTERGGFKGKLSYMAPERIRRQPIDGRSDLFSLGVVLWEMLVGRRLFRAATDNDTLRNVVEAPIPLPSSLRPDVPASLDAVVMRALERDPDRRYATGHELADDLEEVLSETKHQAKMLPILVRELFGAGVNTGQLSVAGLEEHLAAVAESSTLRGTNSATPLAPPLPIVTQAPLPAPQGRTIPLLPARWAWRQIATATFAVSATMALLVMLFARGGGGRSHAMGTPEPAPVTKPVITMPISPPQDKQPAVPSEAPAVTPEEVKPGPVVEPLPAPAAKPGAAEAEATGGGTRRSSRSKVRAERDRITRGLSIDPFADAQRGRK
jgi:eukaryotic-like serine/threonine-protein kinase